MVQTKTFSLSLTGFCSRTRGPARSCIGPPSDLQFLCCAQQMMFGSLVTLFVGPEVCAMAPGAHLFLSQRAIFASCESWTFQNAALCIGTPRACALVRVARSLVPHHALPHKPQAMCTLAVTTAASASIAASLAPPARSRWLEVHSSFTPPPDGWHNPELT